jgi:4'-phosphopantetheinyl transferase EntD
VVPKFLDPSEMHLLLEQKFELSATLLWSAKESMYKWYGDGGVDFSEHLRLFSFTCADKGIIPARFQKDSAVDLSVHFRVWDGLCLTWVRDER